MAATDPSSSEPSVRRVLTAVTKALWNGATGSRLDIVRGALIELVVIALGITGPFALKTVVDGLTAHVTALPHLVLAVTVFVGSWAASAVLSTWRMTYSTRAIDRLVQSLAARAIHSRLPVSARGRDGDSGQMLGLLERLPYALVIVVDGLIWRAVPLALQVVGSLVIVAAIVPFAYAVLLALILAVYVVVTWVGAVRHQTNAAVANTAAAAVSRDVGDVLRNARRVVFNGALDAEIRMIATRFEEKTRANQRMIRSLIAMSVAQYGLIGIGLVVVFGFASHDALIGELSVSGFVLLQAYAFRLITPLSSFGFILSQAAGAIGTVRDVLDSTDEDATEDGIFQSGQGAADIRLDHVGFRYAGNTGGLDDVSAIIPRGAFVVIVGPNGSGKSTLAQLMAGILQPSSGELTVNGQDMMSVPPGRRHELVLYVPQMITLFNRPLRENALYPPTAQTEAGLISLLADWRFHDTGEMIDLSRLAGESGERLSGGQLQKLELARIAGIQVPALILDESTSALDPASEVDVVETLRRRMAGRTTLIVVTHRLGLAEIADHVLLVKAGKLVRQGTHAQLMADSAAYRRLWTVQKT